MLGHSDVYADYLLKLTDRCESEDDYINEIRSFVALMRNHSVLKDARSGEI